jgi:thymidine kinase
MDRVRPFIDVVSPMGSIHVIMGCMYSGKTTEIMRYAHRYQSIDSNIVLINYIDDDRYGDDLIYTHDKAGMKGMKARNLYDISSEELNEASVVIINEGQFFSDLYDFCMDMAEKRGKHVLVCGLDGDFERKPFGDILKLIPVAETVKKLSALCAVCKNGTKAHFSKRIVEKKEQVLIGSDDMYIPVCRRHYIE